MKTCKLVNLSERRFGAHMDAIGACIDIGAHMDAIGACIDISAHMDAEFLGKNYCCFVYRRDLWLYYALI